MVKEGMGLRLERRSHSSRTLLNMSMAFTIDFFPLLSKEILEILK